MAKIGTLISRLLFYKYIGSDEFGNKYYQARQKNHLGRYKRMVEYKGYEEPSKVPPLWNAWLRHTIKDFPKNIAKYDWQKDHEPNYTGTKIAYHPLINHTDNTIKHTKYVGDYESWKPSQ